MPKEILHYMLYVEQWLLPASYIISFFANMLWHLTFPPSLSHCNVGPERSIINTCSNNKILRYTLTNNKLGIQEFSLQITAMKVHKCVSTCSHTDGYQHEFMNATLIVPPKVQNNMLASAIGIKTKVLDINGMAEHLNVPSVVIGLVRKSTRTIKDIHHPKFWNVENLIS